MGQLTKARLRLAGLLAIALGLILWPVYFRGSVGSIQAPDQRKTMPRFSYPTLEGDTWSLESHKGKIVLVNFWATWCGPCREETPDLIRVYSRYRDKGVEVAGVSMDENAVKVAPGFVKQYRVPYPILIPPVESALIAAIQNLPTSFLVDPEGRIARTWVGALRENDLTSAIDQLLSERRL
jgi:thiol-disulfide isomerase/thioredoxin